MKVLIACLIILALLGVCAADHTTKAHRLIQFENKGEKNGSTEVVVDFLASPVPRGEDPAKFPLNRRAVLLKWNEITIPQISTLTKDYHIGSIVILLPVGLELGENVASEDIKRFRELEQYFMTNPIETSVLFAFEDETLNSMEETLKGQDSSSRASAVLSTADNYQVRYSEKPLKKTITVPVSNFEATLDSFKKDVPTVIVTAFYDAFSAAPSLAQAYDSNTSGTAALLSLARHFGLMYKSQKTAGDVNMVFLLTGSGHMDFSATKQFIDRKADAFVKSVKMVICLNAIGASTDLHVHSHVSSKNIKYADLKSALKSVAASKEQNIHFHHRPLPKSPEMEHEVFGAKRIPAVTISSRGGEPQTIESIFDTKVNVSALQSNIDFIAEALAQYIYSPADNASIFAEDVLASGHHEVSQYVEVISKEYSRYVMDPSTADYLDFLRTNLRKYATTELFKTKSDYTFSPPAAGTLTVFRVKSTVFNVYMFLSIFVFCAVLYIAMQGFGKTLREIVNVTKKFQ
eukprot:TRINITY_DN769998_c0_g1_i1.p1 TRINITY_DN769998_c0_g1~~TRINITY_DN769998_c0_g1_i1.p1  ORF type:complete len:518 (-),score=143.31 TRINITY_DN769998_c0_g1_i1:15-1568(-)